MTKPLSSMTGFANSTVQTELGTLVCEIKTVNSRFLDLTIRLSDEIRFVEPKVREIIQNHISRGKMEVRLNLNGEKKPATELDENALEQLLNLQAQLTKKIPNIRSMGVSDILRFPGIIVPLASDRELLEKQIIEALKQSLTLLMSCRHREGQALSKILLSYCDQIETVVNEIRPKIPEILLALKKKLADRLDEALTQPLSNQSTLSREEINDRIRQEVTLYGMKMDVDEEINRLLTHVNECRRVLSNGGSVGRRLDFLMQELNREANTLGSKAVAIEMTDASVSLKLIIEQMREQIQNLE